MKIDPSQLPTTLDALHLALALAVFILLFLLVLVLAIAVIALLRRATKPVIAETPTPPIKEQPPTAIAEPPKETPKPAAPPKPVILREPTPDAALQLLGLLQGEARFVDFIEENISAYSDADVGAAARIVHEGCRKVLKDHFDIEPVRSEKEGSRITVPKGFDPGEIRITGNIVGQPPFQGILVHRGWRVTNVKLPQLSEGHKVEILAPAEVEL